MDLVPAVLVVLDPGADDLDARAFLGHRHARPVERDHLDDEVAADSVVAVGEQRGIVRPQIDVHVTVVGLEDDLAHGPDRDPAAALHAQARGVVDAGQRVPAAAVRRGRRDLPPQGAGRRAADEEDADHRRGSSHPTSVPAAGPRRKSLFRPGLESA